jgi:hypothetical protein
MDDASLLYPRLPEAVAEKLFDAYRGMTLDELLTASGVEHPDATVAALGGVAASKDQLQRLQSEIRAAAREAGFPQRGNQASRNEFDLRCAGILLVEMHIVPAEAAAADVWTFLSAVLLPDVVFWRFPHPPANRLRGRNLTRHTFARLWWRAYQLHDLEPGRGLAALGQINESEMNQLFERRNIGGNRELVRSIARVLVQTNATDIPRRRLVRNGVLHIRRLLPFVMFEALDAIALDDAVSRVMSETADAIRAARTTKAAPRRRATRPDTDQQAFTPPTMSGVEPDDTDSSSPPHDASSPPHGELVDFEDVPLADLVHQISVTVQRRGGLPDDALIMEYQQAYNVRFPDRSAEDLFLRFAWSAAGRRFILRDRDNGLWLPGPKESERLDGLGRWTIRTIGQRAGELARTRDDDIYEPLLNEVFDGPRAPKPVRVVVGRLAREAMGRR